jgi:ABC-2 type transport system permease protein
MVAGANVLVTVTAVLGYEAAYPDPAERRTLATSIASNPGLAALFGEPRALAGLAGFTEWRVVLLLAVVAGVWMLFATTRVLRGEEESGRWEVLLAGPISPAGAALAALVGLSGALLVMLLGTMVGLVLGCGGHLGMGRSALLALTLVGLPALLLGVGAVTSQVARTRRRAVTLGALLLGTSYLVRVLADSAGPRWLRWTTPLGWLEVAHPLTEPDVAPIVLPYAMGLALAVIAVGLSGARDTGDGLLGGAGSRRARTAGLSSALGLAGRLAQGPALAWCLGMATFGALIGLVARTAAQAMADARGSDVLGGLGIEETGARAYVGVSFVLVTLAVAVAAAGQVSATREEEASGRTEVLLVRPVGRACWLGGRLLVSAAVLGLVAAAACLGVVVAGRAGGLDLSARDLAVAGLNTLPVALFVLGIGTLLHGLVPRAASTLTYGLVAASFLLEVVGSTVGLPERLLDLSVMHHVAPAPAVDPDWGSALVLLLLALTAAAGGAGALARRDIVTA